MVSKPVHVSPIKDNGKNKTEQPGLVKEFVIRLAEYERGGLIVEGEQPG